jgi:ribosomal protein S18 acetylase RimI-like enzyme
VSALGRPGVRAGARAPLVSCWMDDQLDGVIISSGFEENDREALASICWSAFHKKYDWIYKKNVRKEKELMAVLPMPEDTVVARIDDKVVGYVSFKTSRSNPDNNAPLHEVVNRHRNWRSVFFHAIEHNPETDELYITMIAVSAETRGKGVGKKLLHKVYETARERELKYVTLHVIFENPDAKRLYNSEGFVDEKQLTLRCCLPRVFSFTGSWFQRKTLATLA